MSDTAETPNETGPDSRSARIVALVAAGEATSRSDLSRRLGLSASTISLSVQELLDTGVLHETGPGPSSGGRRPRVLRLDSARNHVLVADVGGTHARIARVDLDGTPHAISEIPLDVRTGPDLALDELADALAGIALPDATLRGVCLALPGPVDVRTGQVDMPSRMPGWSGFPVADWLTRRFGVTALVDNDTNLMALGEHAAHAGRYRHTVTVKAGSAIGASMIVDGALHRGATGTAGDITHARTAAAGDIPCSCGNTGCLETIASGAALVRELRAVGVDVASTAEVVELARNAHPQATTVVRRAGRHLGEVLCTVVGFFNPDAVLLGGALSTLEPYVAAVRSQLYEGCHPLVTRRLTIDRTACGPDAGIMGAGRLVLDHVLSRPLG